MIALALWLGGLVFFLIVFGPAVRDLRAGPGIAALNGGRIVLEGVAWTGIVLLLFTGMFNLFLRSQATGAHLESNYMILLSLKLLIFGVMVVHHAIQVLKYGPQIAALTASASADAPAWPEPLRAYWLGWFRLLKINATLGPIVMFLGLALSKG